MKLYLNGIRHEENEEEQEEGKRQEDEEGKLMEAEFDPSGSGQTGA